MAIDLGMRDRVVLVTGASRGLGRSLAERLAAEGCSLALCARNRDALTEFAEMLREQFGTRVYVEAVDVTDHDGVARFVRQSADALGALYGVVANAGGSHGGRLQNSTAEDWLATFDVNPIHAASVVRAALPCFDHDVGGSVVLVSSISGWKPSPPAQYAVAKAAMIHLAACLGRELGPVGIRVNAVCPGSMLVPGRRWDRMRLDDPEGYSRLTAEFPSRQLIEPADVAAVIAFLLSEQARAVNGAMIPVDGGQNAPSVDQY